MGTSLFLNLLSGMLASNAIPHFFSGILRRPYPNVFKNSPLVNLTAGWAGLVLAGVCLGFSGVTSPPKTTSDPIGSKPSDFCSHPRSRPRT